MRYNILVSTISVDYITQHTDLWRNKNVNANVLAVARTACTNNIRITTTRSRTNVARLVASCNGNAKIPAKKKRIAIKYREEVYSYESTRSITCYILKCDMSLYGLAYFAYFLRHLIHT